MLTSLDREWMEARAREAGFDLAGVADVPDSESGEAALQEQRFSTWVEAGHAGEM